jgi:hypothetical protein
MQTPKIDCDGGGHGDLTAIFWLAEGFRAAGLGCNLYINPNDGPKVELARLFKQRWTADKAGGAASGGQADWYQRELQEVRGAEPRLKVWMDWWKVPNVSPSRPPHEILDEDHEEMRRILFGRFGNQPFVLLFPFTHGRSREWPLLNWLVLNDRIQKDGIGVAFCVDNHLGLQQIREAPSNVWYLYGFSWGKLAVAMKMASAVLANDSGPAWVAGTLGVPTLAMMGPTKNVFGLIDNVDEVRGEDWCDGCMFNAQSGWRPTCEYQCQSLYNLKTDFVYERLMTRLASTSG